MGILDKMLESKVYKNLSSKLYGWGASAVIIGALFKIEHWQGASTMLIIGLSMEAIIFFVSAFEHPPIMPDWSLVYPELWGIYHEGPMSEEFEARDKRKGLVEKKDSVTQELDKMLEEAKIGPELIASLAKGMNNLSENAKNLSTVSGAADVTEKFVANLSNASDSVKKLSSAYAKTEETMSKQVGVTEEFVNNIKSASNAANASSNAYKTVSENLKNEINANEEYVNSIKQATQSAKMLGEKYTQSAESLTKSAQAIELSEVDGGFYSEQIGRITKNLSALNAIYELQCQGANQQVEKVKQMEESISKFVSNLNLTSESISTYKERADILSQNLSALNQVYGNMLSAMNINIKK